jgi:riboflavin synthase
VGVIRDVAKRGQGLFMGITAGQGLLRYMVSKGSVAIDGISLTVAEASLDSFGVAIIPHTLRNTTLEFKKQGARVNIEADIMGKYVERFSSLNGKTGITRDFLRRHGF